jgi:hypothetical protein
MARDETQWSREDEGAISTTHTETSTVMLIRQRVAANEAPDNSRKMADGKQEI